MLSNIYLATINLSGLGQLSGIFKYIIIGIIYVIIFFALGIMYKDLKSGDKKQVRPQNHERSQNEERSQNQEKPQQEARAKQQISVGLEVIDPGISKTLKMGSVVPIIREVTIGRREDNVVVIEEGYVSGHHARIFQRNDNYVLEDLKSTNGTILNGEKIENKVYIRSGDKIKIGTTLFRVIG